VVRKKKIIELVLFSRTRLRNNIIGKSPRANVNVCMHVMKQPN